MPDNLTTEEAAAYLRMHYKTLLRYARAGVIPHIKLNKRKMLFRKSALEKWLAQRETKAA